MGIRQPSRTAAFFAQAKTGAEEQKKARDKLKKTTPAGQPIQAIGGSATAGTAMVAATTGAQKTATGQVQTKQTGMETDITGEKIVAPSATAKAYTDKVDVGPTSQSIDVAPNTIDISGATPMRDAYGPTTSTGGIVGRGGVVYNPTSLVPMEGFEPSSTPAPSLDRPDRIDEYLDVNQNNINLLNNNKSNIENDIARIDKMIEDHGKGVGTLSAADIKNLDDQKVKLMEKWQQYDDEITKYKLGQIGMSSTFGEEMLKRENVLAGEGNEVGKLAALFGGRKSKYGGIESQIYGKDLEAIQEAAKAGLEEKGLTEKQASLAAKAYKEALGTTKKSVETSVTKQKDIVDKLKIGWEGLKGQGENLASLAKLFGSEAEAKKYFAFDDKGNLTGDRRSEQLTYLKDTRGKSEGELTKTTGKITELNQNSFSTVSNALITKDKYGNVTGGELADVKKYITDQGQPQYLSAEPLINMADDDARAKASSKYLTNLTVIENEINNAIAANDLKRLTAARESLKSLVSEFHSEIPSWSITQTMSNPMAKPLTGTAKSSPATKPMSEEDKEGRQMVEGMVTGTDFRNW